MIPKSLKFHTWTGEVLDICSLCPRDIKLENIAHNLSMLCRFNGSTEMFYSVAEHCVRATGLVKTRAQKRRVLMHDASEAMGIGDLITPLKQHLPLFMEIEEHIQDVIAKKYRFKPGFASESYVKIADRAIGLAEVRDLLRHKGLGEREWWDSWVLPGIMPTVNGIPKIYPWIPREAKQRFLAMAYSLGLK